MCGEEREKLKEKDIIIKELQVKLLERTPTFISGENKEGMNALMRFIAELPFKCNPDDYENGRKKELFKIIKQVRNMLKGITKIDLKEWKEYLGIG